MRDDSVDTIDNTFETGAMAGNFAQDARKSRSSRSTVGICNAVTAHVVVRPYCRFLCLYTPERPATGSDQDVLRSRTKNREH